MGHEDKNLLRPIVDTGPSAHWRHVWGTDAPGRLQESFKELQAGDKQRCQASASSAGFSQVGRRAEHIKERESGHRSRETTTGSGGGKEGERWQSKRPKMPDSKKSRTKQLG